MSSSRSIHPVVDDALGNSSYVVDAGSGKAIVVDPRRDIDAYLQSAEERSLRIVAIFETHLHADFVSGARELVAATGAELYAAKDSGLRHQHIEVAPFDRFVVGDASIEVIGTPGHTPEHLAFFLTTSTEAGVFSGGS